jgi:hypothetical protein
VRDRIRWLSSVGLVALIAVPAPARAGSLEIDQLCAAVGCFPGDAPGFPVSITAPGEYRLTSNLDLRSLPGAENTKAILISADDVTVDLAGFALLGPTLCSGQPTTCAPTGTGSGVSSSGKGTTVRDGAVTGFGSSGVSIVSGRLEGIRSWSNGSNGLLTVGEAAVVVDSAAFRNGNDGIQTYRYAVIAGSTAAQNGHDGVNGRQASAVEESVSFANGRVGYWAETELKVRYSIATTNGNGGLSGFAVGSVGAGNGTYGVTEGFPNEGAALLCALSANSSAPFASGVESLSQNVCDGSSC